MSVHNYVLFHVAFLEKRLLKQYSWLFTGWSKEWNQCHEPAESRKPHPAVWCLWIKKWHCPSHGI